jgi:hypothetical protein
VGTDDDTAPGGQQFRDQSAGSRMIPRREAPPLRSGGRACAAGDSVVCHMASTRPWTPCSTQSPPAPSRVRDSSPLDCIILTSRKPRRLRDRAGSPQPAARLLPRAAQARVARSGRRRPRLRHRSRADEAQRQPPRSPAVRALPGQLPDRRPADDRRALGLAEHAEAGPHREPEAPRRGDDGRSRGAPPTPTWRGSTPRGRGTRRRCRARCTRRTSCSSCSASGSTAQDCRRSD